MNFLKELVADSLNGFVLSDIPFMLFRIFVAGAIGFVLALLLSRKEENTSAWMFVATAMFLAVLGIVVAFSVPLAIVMLPVILLLNPTEGKSQYYRFVLALAVGAGIACGGGYVFMALLGLILIVPVILLSK